MLHFADVGSIFATMNSKAFNSADDINRRDFVQRAAMTAAAFAVAPPLSVRWGSSKDDVLKQIPLQHDQTVKMLRDLIALPSIAAENRGYPQGAEYMAQLARDAGFQNVRLVPSAGKPGVFTRIDADGTRTLGRFVRKEFRPIAMARRKAA